MAIIKTITTKNIANLDKYIENGVAHDSEYSDSRNLLVDAYNLKRDYAGGYSPLYVASQQFALRKAVGKERKKVQGHHLIVSFSESDFPPVKDPKKDGKKESVVQAQQALKLVKGLLKKELPSTAQYLVGIQRDGKGHKLHAHVALTSVTTDGKTLDTNLLSLLQKKERVREKKGVYKIEHKAGLIERTQNYMSENFKAITGRNYQRVSMPTDSINISKSSEMQINNRDNGYNWKNDLKSTIVEVAKQSTSQQEFIDNLVVNGVKLRQRKASIGKDETGKKIYRDAYTYSFTGADGKLHKARDFAYTKSGALRGLGKSYTPDNLDKIFALVLQQKKEREAQELSQYQENINIKKLQKEEGKNAEFKQGPIRRTQESDESESEQPKITRIKKVEVSKAHRTYKTDTYDDKTRQKQADSQKQRDQQRAIEEARFAQRERERQLAEIERKRRDVERKRKNKNKRIERQHQQWDSWTEAETKHITRKPNQNSHSSSRPQRQPSDDEPDFD